MLFGGCGDPGGIGFRPGVAVVRDQAALRFVVCFAELVQTSLGNVADGVADNGLGRRGHHAELVDDSGLDLG
jgi:hypothetical protein